MKLVFLMLCVMLAICSIAVQAGTITSKATGNWNSVSTWDSGVVPTADDDVIIANSHTVSLDSTLTYYCKSLTIGKGSSGKLQYAANANASTTLIISGNFSLATGAQFILGSIGTYKPVVYLGGNLNIGNTATYNPVSGSTKGVVLVFNNPNSGVDQTITATGTPTTFVMGFLQVNRPLPTDKVVCSCNMGMKGGGDGLILTCGTFEQTAGRFILPTAITANATCSLGYPNGRIRVTGSGSMLFTSAVTGAGSANGMACPMYINTTDTVFVGASTTAGIQGATKFVNDATLTIDAGTLNVYGRLVTEAGGLMSVNGGTVNLDPQMSGSLTGSSSTLQVLANGSFSMSGGTINIIDPLATTGSGSDISMSTSGTTYNITGGTINVGDGVSTSTGAAGFKINAHNFPFWNLNINGDNNSPGRTVTLTDGTTPKNLIVQKALSINSGTLNANVATGSNITLGGTFVNNGTLNLGTASAIALNGAAAQNTGSSFPTTVQNLTINNPANVTLYSPLTVNGNLVISSGDLITGANSITLGGSGTISETAGSIVLGNLTTTRTLSQSTNDNFGGLGVEINAAGNAPGSTTVTRVTGTSVSGDGNISIKRYYNITPSSNSDLNATLVFHYDDRSTELNGLDETKLQLFKSTDGGSSWKFGSGTINTTNNTITLNGISDFSMWTAGSSDFPLPVELSSLTAQVSGRNIHLNWTTATEVNTFAFKVERNIEKSDDWVTIGEVKANLYSNSPKTYSFIDKNLNTGKYNYRLKMIDQDGTYEYSAIQTAVEIAPPSELILAHNYPNPFNPSTIIEYSIPSFSKVNIKIFNAIGQEVAQLIDEMKLAGHYNVRFQASSLPSGVYYCQLRAGNVHKTMKMLLVK